jgi:hypothetical protein
MAGVAALAPQPAFAVCSVFSRHPCAPATCGVYHRGPCRPFYGFPIGENLQVSISSRNDETAKADDPDNEPHHQGEKPEHEVDTLRELFAALRACWLPPEQGHKGMSLAVRFAFRRDGSIISTPQVTYMNRSVPDDVRDRFHDAVTAALDRCTPMPFTQGLAAAIAGRPINIRFIDDRTPRSDSHG